MDIDKLIRQGESETLEFKQSFDKEAVISIGAMANNKGGTVLIGVSDKGEIKGTQIQKETLQRWSNQIAQVTDPRLIPVLTARQNKDKIVVIIDITEFPIKPVAVYGRCYLRVGNSNKQLGTKQITDLHLQSLNLSWDSYVAIGKTLKDVHLTRVRQYIQEVNKKGRRELKGAPLHILQKLELLKDGKPTWACCLLFRNNPYGTPNATVRVARFKGTATIIDDNVIEGSLLDQFDATVKAIMRNIGIRYKIKGRIKREEIWDYPIEAIREAVLNAICHRDYRATADIQIKIYDDYIHLWNPGELPYNITIDDLLNNRHISYPRNRLVTQAFYDLGNIERLGSGIERIFSACKATDVPAPEFKEEMGGFSVTFRKSKISEEYDEYLTHIVAEPETAYMSMTREESLLNYLKVHKMITLAAYKKLVPNVSEKTLYRDLQSMVGKFFLLEIGHTKGRKYVLAKEFRHNSDIIQT